MKLHVGHGAYICSEKKYDNRWIYLRKDGTLGTSLRGKNDWFENKQEAQQFLDSWMPRKKRLTISEVEEASKLSEEEALDCSIEHWKQNVLDVDNAHLGSSYCVVCERAQKKSGRIGKGQCVACILNNYEYGVTNCCKEYKDFCREQTEENAIAMLNKLVLIRNNKYGNRMYGNPYKKYNIGIDLAKEKLMTKEMTVAQVVKELGYDVKIVKEPVKLKPKLKHGDIVQDNGGATRIILKYRSNLTGFNECSDFSLSESFDQWADRCGYYKVGNIFEDYKL